MWKPQFAPSLNLLDCVNSQKPWFTPFARVWKIFKIWENVVYQSYNTFQTLQLSCTKCFKFSSNILSKFENTKNLPNLSEFDLNCKYQKYSYFAKEFYMKVIDLEKIFNFHVCRFWTFIQMLKVIWLSVFSFLGKIQLNSKLGSHTVWISKFCLHNFCREKNFSNFTILTKGWFGRFESQFERIIFEPTWPSYCTHGRTPPSPLFRRTRAARRRLYWWPGPPWRRSCVQNDRPAPTVLSHTPIDDKNASLAFPVVIPLLHRRRRASS